MKQHISVLKTCTRLLGTALTILIRPHYKTDPIPFFLIYFLEVIFKQKACLSFNLETEEGKKMYFCNCCGTKGKCVHVIKTTVWENWSVTHTVWFSTSNSSKTLFREVLHSLLGMIKERLVVVGFTTWVSLTFTNWHRNEGFNSRTAGYDAPFQHAGTLTEVSEAMRHWSFHPPPLL